MLLYDSWQKQLRFRRDLALPVDVLGQHFRLVPDGNAAHCNFDSSDNH